MLLLKPLVACEALRLWGGHPLLPRSSLLTCLRHWGTVRPVDTSSVVAATGDGMKVLNVAEKNDAAKNLASIMSGGRSRMREGLSRFNKIYEFDFELQGRRCQMTMTSVSGHLLNYDFAASFRKWMSCSPAALFDCPVIKQCSTDYEPIMRTLEREARRCQMLVIWTDCDREGENIGFEIINVCRAVNPQLKVLRARFSEITPASVRRAVNNLVEPDGRASAAVDVRQELDLRIGAAFTRFQTLRLKQVFPARLADHLISYGSCQFPTLGFVVERYKTIQSFIPESFWKIKVSHMRPEGNVDFNWKRVRLFDEACCRALFERCCENSTATITHVQSKPKSKWRPVPLDTVELEKLASRKLRITAKETMKVAEKLYTQGLISYPRTETNIFPKELALAPLVQQQVNDPNWGAFAARLLETGPNPRQGKKTDNAHPPIHPTKYAPGLQGNEQRLYEFVVRHFLACLSADAQGQETTVEAEVAGEKFSANGLMITARNYLEVYPYDKWSDKELPVYRVGQQFASELAMPSGETTPPPLLTEADLIALMDKHGIGTDATHADHIETIKSRQYVGLEDGRFMPGCLGMGLVEGYDSMGFHMSKPNLRAELEADLKRICEGTRDPATVLREQITAYKNVFEEAMRQAQKLDTALSPYLGEPPAAAAAAGVGVELQMPETVCRCPACGQPVLLKTLREGTQFMLSCSGYPACRVAMWMPSSVESLTVSQQHCTACRGQPKMLDFTFRTAVYAPYYPRRHTACVAGCDMEFLETVGLKSLSASAQGGGSQQNGDSGYISTLSQARPARAANHRPPAAPAGQSQPAPTLGRPRPAATANHRPPAAPAGQSQAPARPRPPPATNGRPGEGGGGTVCECGTPAVLLTVRKEGPNTGRQFYKCDAAAGGRGCNFFLWADEGAPPRPTQAQRPPAQAQNGGGDAQGDVTCGCGLPPRRCTVQKEGPNQGREFLGCSKPRDQGCRFFQWCDEPPRPPGECGSELGWPEMRGYCRVCGGIGVVCSFSRCMIIRLWFINLGFSFCMSFCTLTL
ncbi:DNA topoisomerase 3-alpha [Amphibalanus amphitrite]|uniref:DNA topoisomerase n=1 Tax=Amphibalanus amphitrite TaxID=1232801 RepID=A0A6A4WJK8_AMPAM|nr:DNA topoisomerase 3-alpha [Amphibalanus amphitrite]